MSLVVSPPEQIDLEIPSLKGFYHFIGCWCFTTQHSAVLVDPGPAATIPTVLEYLEDRAIKTVSAILLTHIHIDHAGGVGLLAKAFPEANVVCPSRSIPHLIDPTRLMEGSRKVLGSLIDDYDAIAPVNAQQLIPAEESEWLSLATPGHSADHTSYLIDGYLFCGEALGVVCAPLSDTYRRPATPPRFELGAYQASISLLARQEAHTACFGHFGSLSWNTKLCRESHEQIDRWVEVVSTSPSAPPEVLIEQLVEKDPLFAPFATLPEVIQSRERSFVLNSLKGIQGFVFPGRG